MLERIFSLCKQHVLTHGPRRFSSPGSAEHWNGAEPLTKSSSHGGAQVQRREVEIVSKQGLNAAASSKLAQLAAKYLCDVSLARGGRKVNAKSLMGVMMLAAGQGSRVVVETEGPSENEALEAVVALIANGFGEGQ